MTEETKQKYKKTKKTILIVQMHVTEPSKN